MRLFSLIAILTLCTLPMTAQAAKKKVTPSPTPTPAASPVAQAELKDAKGNTVGTVTFAPSPHGVKMVLADAHDLPPGAHGIHIHETGKCDGPDFKSAGGHLNPGHKEHGLSNAAGPHAGDLPNLVIGADGKGMFRSTTDRVSLDKGDNSILKDGGTAVVVHAKVDDQKTSPSGDSGDRIACGVVTAIAPASAPAPSAN